MQCVSCNKAIDDDSLFCKFCGNPIHGFSEDKILPILFTDLTEEIRSRREAEHIYTAAAVGSFGAVAWGVAALGVGNSLHPPYQILHPAIIASIGTLLVAATVIAKIRREHRNYAGLRSQLGAYSTRISKVFGIDYLPAGLTSGEAGPGYRESIKIVSAGAILAVGFCLSVWCVAH